MKAAWDVLVAVTAILNGFYVPYIFAFAENYHQVVHLSVFCIFLLDILVQFRVTVLDDKTGDEILAPCQIARRYVASPEILIDLIAVASFPFN